MKTLNRTLSLVLVLVMVLGLFGVASAKFNDDATIQYKEAVDVAVGIGAIDGYADGTFNPKGDITREEAAKLITYAILGPTLAKTLTVSNTGFKDVASNRWSAPFITYLVNKGIINGMGDGTFDPTGKVTGYQLGKMLLTAIGYGKNGEYTGTSWELNTAVDANKYGIFTGSKAANFTAPATREEAALYVFNGLTNDKAVQVAWNKTTEKYDQISTKETIGVEVYGLAKSADTKSDDFGRPASAWTVTGKTAPIALTPAAPVATFNDASYVKAFASYDFASDVKILVNGKAISGLSTVSDLTGRAYNGVGIELYNTDTDKDIDVIVLTQAYLTKVADYKETKGTSFGSFKLEVNNPWAGAKVDKTITDTKATDELFDQLLAAGFKKGDYLIVYTDAAVADATILKFAKVTTAAGALSSYSATDNNEGFNGNVTVGGTKYTLASGAVDNRFDGFISNDAGGALQLSAHLNKNVTVFIDEYGMVLGVVAEKPAEVATELYYVVNAYEQTTTDSYGNLTTKVSAQAVDMTGKEVNFFLGVKSAELTKDAINTTYQNNLVTAKTSYNNTLKADVTALTVFTTKDLEKAANGITDDIGKNDVKVSGTNDYFSADTVFLFVENTGASLKVTKATGVQATTHNYAYYATKAAAAASNYTVKYVVVAGAPTSTSIEGESLIFVPKTFTTASATGYTLANGTTGTAYINKGFIDGAAVDILTTGTTYETDKDITVGFYKYTKAANGIYTLTPADSGVVDNAKITNVYGNLVSWSGNDDKNATGAYVVDVTGSSEPITTIADLNGASVYMTTKSTNGATTITGIYVTAHKA